MRFELASRVVAIPDQVSCDLAGEAAILSLKDGVYYGLNTVGARIWNLVQEPRQVQDVLTTLLREYDVEPIQCEADLHRVLGDLASHGLLEKV